MKRKVLSTTSTTTSSVKKQKQSLKEDTTDTKFRCSLTIHMSCPSWENVTNYHFCDAVWEQLEDDKKKHSQYFYGKIPNKQKLNELQGKELDQYLWNQFKQTSRNEKELFKEFKTKFLEMIQDYTPEKKFVYKMNIEITCIFPTEKEVVKKKFLEDQNEDNKHRKNYKPYYGYQDFWDQMRESRMFYDDANVQFAKNQKYWLTMYADKLIFEEDYSEDKNIDCFKIEAEDLPFF